MKRIMKRTSRKFPKLKKTQGQTLVEFALILPVLLISLFIIIELARILHAWMALENGARTGIRFAVTGEYDANYCTDIDADGVCDSLSEEPGARVDSIHDAAWAGSTSIIRLDEGDGIDTTPGYFKVTVCNPDNVVPPTSTFDVYTCGTGEDPGVPGGEVSIIMEFNHPVILPGLSSIVPEIRLTARRDATNETFRMVQAGSGAPGADPPDPGPPNPPPPPPEPPDPCENIILEGLELSDRSKNYPNRMWKLDFALYNNNYFDGTISWIQVEWPDTLDLDRWVYRYLGVADPRITLTNGQKTGPLLRTNLPFPAGQPPLAGMPTMYGELCVDLNDHCKDNDDVLKDAPIIPAGDYTFTVTGVFDFGEYGTCPLNLSFTGTATPASGGGGGGGGDPWDPPDPPPGGEDPPPGGGGGGPND